MQDLETSLALVVQKLEHIERGLDEMRAHLGDKLEIHDDRLRKMEVAIALMDHASLLKLRECVDTLKAKQAWMMGIGAAITFILSTAISIVGIVL